MALDPQLPRPMSRSQFNDERYNARLKDISKDWCFHWCTSFFIVIKFVWLGFLYSQAMKIISSITTYFSHSNQATHHLKHEMKMEQDKRRIEVAGVTHYSTFTTHASSISRCFSGIQRCLTAGTVKFNTAVVRHWWLCEVSIGILQYSRQNLSQVHRERPKLIPVSLGPT